LLTGLVQAGLVLVALKYYRVPKSVAARMAANVLVDISVGAIPLLGDLFDVVFKANTANLKLLEPYREKPADIELMAGPDQAGARSFGMTNGRVIGSRPRGTPWRYILPIAAVLVVALILVLIGFVTVVRWLFSF
jgi:hypothetical protein